MRSKLYLTSSAVTARSTGGANLASGRSLMVYVVPSAEITGMSAARSGIRTVPSAPGWGASRYKALKIESSTVHPETSQLIAGSSVTGSPSKAILMLPPILGVPPAALPASPVPVEPDEPPQPAAMAAAPQGSTPATSQIEGEVARGARAMDADPGVAERAAEDHAPVSGALHPEQHDPLRRCRHGADAGARDVLPGAPPGVAGAPATPGGAPVA